MMLRSLGAAALGLSMSITGVVPGAQIGQRSGARDPHEGRRRFFEQRTYGGQSIPLDAYEKAKKQWDMIPKGHGRRSPGVSTSSVSGVVWKAIGPSPFSDGTTDLNGRVNSIAVNPNNSNVIYIGASGGGVWRTNDAGDHWTSLIDHEAMLSIGEPAAIAIDPNDTNTVYVGSSTRVNNTTGAQGAALNRTLGVLKTTDGGGSWIALGSGFPSGNTGNATQFKSQDIFALAVDPVDSTVVYLAASSGLFTSNDGGLNWTLGTNGSGFAESLVLDSSSPAANRVLFASKNAGGVFLSTDGGGSWTQVLSSATPAVAAALAAHVGPPPNNAPAGMGKVAVALAPPASPPNANGVQVIYVTIEGVSGDFIPSPYTNILGIFESTDQGATWTQRNATGIGQCQCFYTNTIAVDPASSGDGANDIVYWGGTNSFRSSDSAASFTDVTHGIHADSHGWGFARPPSGPTIVYAGNDGGIWRSTDSGATWTGTAAGPATINAGGLQIAQFYHMDVKRDATASVSLGALQDNGTLQYIGSPNWTSVLGGDGLVAVFDHVNQSNAYSINNGGPNRSTSNGDSGSWNDITSNLPNGGTNDQVQIFSNTLNVDPSNGGYLYFGGATNTPPNVAQVPGQLFQSTNSGGAWRAITSLTALSNVGPAAVAPANANNVAVADGASVFVSTNALAATVGPPNGVTFTNITRNLPARAVTRVAFDPNDSTIIYATLSGFGGGHLFRTTINGNLWTNISPPVDVPFDAIELDGASSPTTIYVGTDLGVLRSVSGGAAWTTFDDIHFPNAPVTDLQLNAQAGVFRASTYGRGVFDFVAASGPVIAANGENGLDVGDTCLGVTTNLTLQVFNVGTTNLVVYSVQNLMGSADFTVLPNPLTPVTISADAEVDFTVRFTPTSRGPKQAVIRISSNDPGAPFFDLTATATVGAPNIATLIADGGSFGDVCRGSFRDLNLTISNSGTCDLVVNNITSSSSDFLIAGIVTFPLAVSVGGAIQVPIRFAPSALGPKSAILTISSNDPNTPSRNVAVSGNVPPGDVRVTGSTAFGDVCPGTLAEKTVSVCNVGACNLAVTSVAFEPPCADFTLVNNPFPATVSPDSCDDVVIRFTPTSPGPKTCTLVVRTDDPDSPVISLQVTGNTPFAMIDVPPDLTFAPTVIQSVGPCDSRLAFPISNTGACNLVITDVSIVTDPAEYSLVGLPSFPIILQPGHIVGEGNLRVRFAPTALGRARSGQLRVVYVSNPITGTTTTVNRQLCGEGVQTGARLLVTVGGSPINQVKKIQLARMNGNQNGNPLDTIETIQNVPLAAVVQGAPCSSFQFHREWGTAGNPVLLLPGSYRLFVTVRVNGHNDTRRVGFDVSTCDFNPTIVVNF